MTANHTPGPWYADDRGRIWRRNPLDLYENGGAVAGDKPIATVYTGWETNGYPMPENASLIAAAPDLLAALEAALPYMGLDLCGAAQFRCKEQARTAIAKAKGE